MSRKAWWAASMGIVRKSMPRLTASSSASPMESGPEKRDGIATPWTCSAPSASTAMVATSDESTPPDSPSTTSVKPFFSR